MTEKRTGNTITCYVVNLLLYVHTFFLNHKHYKIMLSMSKLVLAAVILAVEMPPHLGPIASISFKEQKKLRFYKTLFHLAIFLSVFLVITGAWLGFWVVRKVVLTEDGSIDTGVSHFVTWSIRIVASVMILQSSTDPLLAAEALLGGIFVSSVLRSSGHPKVARRVYKTLSRLDKITPRQNVDPYVSPDNNSSFSRPFTKTQYTPVQGSTSKSPRKLLDTQTFFSTFHETPNRRKFSKDEWESFTKESTRKALEGLVSSPDFSKWAVTHADRITLAPKKEIADKQRWWFNWF